MLQIYYEIEKDVFVGKGKPRGATNPLLDGRRIMLHHFDAQEVPKKILGLANRWSNIEFMI